MSVMDRLSQLLGRVLPGDPIVLEGRDIPSVAKFLKSDECKNVFLMVGAGISTSAGIPDFRSPDTGLYANLAKLHLPYPEAVFDIRYFSQNPKPFYTLAAELYPGYYRPTVTHSFIRLLAEKGKLYTCFTQNIDTLERRAGVPVEKIFEAHGSFASQRCIKCKNEYPTEDMMLHVKLAEVPHCVDEVCGGVVKPDIVFFGEGLPDTFEAAVKNLEEADLLIIMGTSLTVYPFAALRSMVPAKCPRVLINLDRVGDIGARADDVALLMPCDEAVRKLCDEIGDGWREELERLWVDTENTYTPRPTEEASVIGKGDGEKVAKGKLSKNPHLEDEVARIAKMVEEKMKVEDGPADPAPEDKPAASEESQPKETLEDTSAASVRPEPSAAPKAGMQTPAVEKPAEVGELAGPTHPTPHYETGELSVPQTKPSVDDVEEEKKA
ncbi:Sir2 histone deacetylase Hst2 [Tulasnella sp. 427]|nr:Sir2 histone deacetylase Hst2 [Tulasnella sp. 427]